MKHSKVAYRVIGHREVNHVGVPKEEREKKGRVKRLFK